MKAYLLKPLVVAFALLFALNAFAGEKATPDTLRVMTYNIKFLPRHLYFIKHKPVKRAKYIAEALLKENLDVVVFQEAFDHVGLHILRKKMKKAMPYTAGHLAGHILVKNTGGVLMFSKYKMTTIAYTRYKQCKGVDCYAHKGATLAEIEVNHRKVQILGTHIQAGGSKELKKSQFDQMAELGKANQKEGVLQLYVGDFNTQKRDTVLYPYLVDKLGVKDGDITGELQYTSDHSLNDMDSYNVNKKNLIDYIFVKANGVEPISTIRQVKRLQYPWSATHKDLSDHFAVVMELVF